MCQHPNSGTGTMNKQRRKQIEDMLEILSGVETELETLTEEEQGAIEALPEQFQTDEKMEALDQLETAKGALDDLIYSLQEAKDL